MMGPRKCYIFLLVQEQFLVLHFLLHKVYHLEVLNETQPKYASTLVLTAHKGMEHFQNRYKGNFIELSQAELFTEMQTFINALDLKETIFRSDHASNNLILKGILGRDKQVFLDKIKVAINNPENAGLRPKIHSGY